MSLPLTEKYRPHTFSDILGNEVVIQAIGSLIAKNELPNMLFYGPPGTGKTTTIRAIAKKIYTTPHLHVLELNASDDRGIQIVRETIKSFASTAMTSQMKLIILDEADSMSKDAQNALRRIIEDFSTNVRFCFIANYASKIIPAILSRCCRFRFGPVRTLVEDTVVRLCKNENIGIDESGVQALVDFSDGDMRALMNLIEGLSHSFNTINQSSILLFNGCVDESIYERLFNDLCTLGFDDLKVEVNRIIDTHLLDCESILQKMGVYVRNSSFAKKMSMLKCFSDIEYRLSLGCSRKVQVNAMIGVFLIHRD